MFSKLNFLAATAVSLVAMVASPGAAAASYDAVADFSTTTNSDASRWSYRTSASLAHNGAYGLLPAYAAFGGFTGPPAATSGWTTGFVPAIGVNTSGADQYFTGSGPGAQFTWQAGAMLMHPGASTLAVVSWLSPEASSLRIDFRFADMDANPNFADGVAWSVELNGSAVLASGSFGNGGQSGALSLANVIVAAGDRIHFIVGPNGDFQGDSTRLQAFIQAAPVPEPSSGVLLLAGLAAAGWARRRRPPTG